MGGEQAPPSPVSGVDTPRFPWEPRSVLSLSRQRGIGLFGGVKARDHQTRTRTGGRGRRPSVSRPRVPCPDGVSECVSEWMSPAKPGRRRYTAGVAEVCVCSGV